MHELISYHIPDAVRVQVIKLESHSGYAEDDSSIDVRRFSVDPLITNFAAFQATVVHLFNLKSDFVLSYYRTDINKFVPLQCEWDLDAAYISSSSPFLQVKMIVERVPSYPDWDIITMADMSRIASRTMYQQSSNITSGLFSQVEKLASRMSRVAFQNNAQQGLQPVNGLPSLTGSNSSHGSLVSSSTNCSFESPLSEKQYLSYLEPDGRVRSLRELRITVYRRGLDPGLRKIVWKHLLNVFPPGLSGQQRIDYIRTKCDTYNHLKSTWSSHMNDPKVEAIHSMVKKDVLRTDRKQSFYAGNEENKNIKSLLNILTTFSLNHEISYCQGMSDLASPILYVLKDESQAYICFTALMKRSSGNFSTNGISMSLKFQNLIQLVMYYDPEYYCYLKRKNAQELLFCYRWLLLDLKREFPFEDSLRVLEVLWSSIPPTFSQDLPLFDDGFKYIPESNQSTPTNNTLNCSHNVVKYVQPVVKHGNSPVVGKFDPEIMSVKQTSRFVTGSNSIEISPKPKKRSTFDDEVTNMSSGRGSMCASICSSTSGTIMANSAPVGRPTFGLRKIRFLPTMLSTDSKDLDSPEEEDMNNRYPLPPRFIERQISIDYEEKKRLRKARFSGSSVGSFDRDDLRRIRSFDVDGDANGRCRTSSLESLSPKRRAQLARFNSSGKSRLLQRQISAQKSIEKDQRQKSIEPENYRERFAHCNGVFESFDDREGYSQWTPPIGLLRSNSYDSLHGSQYFTPTGSFRESSIDVPEDVPKSNLEESRSRSSSNSSLVILSSSGMVLDYSQNFRISLPSPEELGSNDAFMLFLCLTLLLQHRDTIMSRDYDCNEIAMFYDSLIRKHKVGPVLETARQLFHSYLSQWHRTSLDSEEQVDEIMQKTLLKFPAAHQPPPQMNNQRRPVPSPVPPNDGRVPRSPCHAKMRHQKPRNSEPIDLLL